MSFIGKYANTKIASPKRIVSLVPSQTELLYDLGLEDEVVGITKFCIHPDSWFRNKKRVGGTKTVHPDIIAALQPDLIIANKEENTREEIEQLASLYPVWMSDIKTVDDALGMILNVGALVGKAQNAQMLIMNILAGLDDLKYERPADFKPCRVAYFIWRNPWMSVGGDTFISDMITRMGWVNVLREQSRYPELDLNALKELNVDKVLLSSEPYPFKDAHIAEIKAVLPHAEVMLVDGEMFSWYGSRMLRAVKYLSNFQ